MKIGNFNLERFREAIRSLLYRQNIRISGREEKNLRSTPDISFPAVRFFFPRNNDNNVGGGGEERRIFRKRAFHAHVSCCSSFIHVEERREFRGISWLRREYLGKRLEPEVVRGRGAGRRERVVSVPGSGDLARRRRRRPAEGGEVKRQYRRKLIIGVRCTPRREQNTGEQ